MLDRPGGPLSDGAGDAGSVDLRVRLSPFLRTPSSRCPAVPGGRHAHGATTTTASPPTAVLFGWMGAEDKQLQPYATLYEEMGYNTVRCTVPVSEVMSGMVTAHVRAVVAALANDGALHRGGIVLHLFSYGGTVPFASLVDVVGRSLQDDCGTVRDNLVGCVFDSGPVFPTPEATSKLLLTHSQLVDRSTLVEWCVWAVNYSCSTLLDLVGIGGKRMWDRLCNWSLPNVRGELYLLGRRDDVLDAARLRDLVRGRQARFGAHVRSLEFAAGGHTGLLRSGRRMYACELAGFHQWCVNAWRDEVGLGPWRLPTERLSSDYDNGLL